MVTAVPYSFDPIFEALDRAPMGEEDMTAGQRAEFARIAADYEAGRATLVAHDDMPAALEAIALA